MSKSYSTVDLRFRRLLLLSKLFTKSWGRTSDLKRLFQFRRSVIANRQVPAMVHELHAQCAITIAKDWPTDGGRLLEGSFTSPLALACPGLMPSPVDRAYWRALMPAGDRRAAVILLAGTGDHGFYRRQQFFARNLAASGIASVMLENPFYGRRKPKYQFRSSLNNVCDLFVMGAALICECVLLLHWLHRNQGFSCLGLTGVSMGGHMASLAATNWPSSVCLIPLLSWTTASPVFTRGALSNSIPWHILKKELESSEFVRQIEAIPDCNWIPQMRMAAESGLDPTKEFMRILMDEFTHLRNFPLPYDTRLVKAVVAEQDAYVLRSGVESFDTLWPGAQVIEVPGGHITAYFKYHDLFRRSIVSMLELHSQYYPSPCL